MLSILVSHKNRACVIISTLIGSFMGQACLVAQDADLIAIGKEKFHSQDSASGALLEDSEPYGAFVFIGESSPGSILANPVPFILEPDTTTTQLTFDEDGWNFEGDYDDMATLDAEAPNGTYTINYTGANDGAVSGSLTISGDAYPNAPSLTEASFNALQSATFSSGFTIEWVPFQNGTADDFINVFIEEISSQGGEDVFETAPFEIPGTATTFDVPAGILTDGGGYEVCIEFLKVVDTAMIGGAQAAAFYGSDNCVGFGDTSRKSLQIGFFQNAGSFNAPAGNQVTTNIFPVSNQMYNLTYGFEDDAANFPDQNLIIFDGPAGSPLSGVLATGFFGPDQGVGFGNYATVGFPLPVDVSALSGTYRVSISDAEILRKEVDFPSLVDQSLVVVPTVNLNLDNTIQSIDIDFKDLANQDPSSTDFIRNISITISDESFTPIFQSFNISPTVSSIVPSSLIAWDSVQAIGFFYSTQSGGFYDTQYDKSINQSEPDVLGGTDIEGFPGWKGSPWYMNYNVDFWPWIFHDEHGWQFVATASTSDVIFVWDLGLGEWVFFNENSYRWIFIFGGDNAGWVFTFGDNRPDRRFFQRLDDGSLFSVPPGLPVN